MDGQNDSFEKASVNQNGVVKTSIFYNKPSLILQDSDDDVCGFNVNIKSLLENEEIRKQLEPFIEMETIYQDSSESEIEEVTECIENNSSSPELNDNQSVSYDQSVTASISEWSEKKAVESRFAENFYKNNETSNASDEMEILSLSDSSDDEKVVKKKKIFSLKRKLSPKQIFESEELMRSPPKKFIKNARSLPRISNIINCSTPFKLSVLKRQEPEKKDVYMKNLELEPFHDTPSTENEIQDLNNLINTDLSSDAKILSFVDKLCDTENDPLDQSAVSDNMESILEQNSSVLDSSDYYYLKISEDKKISEEKNISLSKKVENEIFSKDVDDKFENKIMPPKKNIKFFKTAAMQSGQSVKSDNEHSLIENKMPLKEKIQLKNDSPPMKNEVKSTKEVSPLKTNTESNHTQDCQILKITDDILPVETVAPKRRGRKRKRGKKVVTYGKIGLQEKSAKKNPKSVNSTVNKSSLNDLIQDTLSETIKSFYSTDQLPPIKQEVQEPDPVIFETPEQSLKEDSLVKEKNPVIHTISASSENILLDPNNLLSVCRTESIQEFYKSKNQQKKKRKKRKRLIHMKYQNIDRSQWTFLPRQKREKENIKDEQPRRLKFIMGECKKCGKQYERLSCLRMHESLCSGVILKNNRECAICHYKAKNRTDFKAHLVTHILEAPPSLQNIADRVLPLSNNETSDRGYYNIKNKLNQRKVGKKKFRIINRKKMEMRKIGLRSSNVQFSEAQVNSSSEAQVSQVSESSSPKKRFILRRGRRVYQQRIHQSKKRDFSQSQVNSSTIPVAFEDLDSSSKTISNQESESLEHQFSDPNTPNTPISKKRRYKIRRINKYYKYTRTVSNLPRVGVLAYCMAHCRKCVTDTFAERRRLYCQLCSSALVYWCAMCKKQFFAFGGVRAHLITSLKEKITPEMKCPKCYRSHFSTRCSLRRHKRMCNTTVRFDKQCFVQLERCEFQPDLFKGQPGVYHVHCESCKITKVIFKEETNCNNCQSLLHYKCEICDKLLVSNSDLRNHVLNVHIMGIDSYDSNVINEDDDFTLEDEDQSDHSETECSSSESVENRNTIDQTDELVESDDNSLGLVERLKVKSSSASSLEKDLCLRTLNLSLTDSTSTLEENGTSSQAESTFKQNKEFDENIDATKISKDCLIRNDESLSDDDFAENTETTEIQISSTQLLEIIGASTDHSEFYNSSENDEFVEKAQTNKLEENKVKDCDLVQNDMGLQIHQTSPKEALIDTLDNELPTEKVLTNVSEGDVHEDFSSSKYSDSMENDICLQINLTSPKEASTGTLDNELPTEKVLPSVSEENVDEDDTSSKYSDSMENDISLQIDQTSPKEASTDNLNNELPTEKVLPSVSEENVDEDDTSSKYSDSMENDISLQIGQTSPKKASTGTLDNKLPTEKVLPSVSEENVVEDNTSSKSSDSMENDISLQIDQTSPKEASTGTLDNELSTEKVLPSVSEENVDEDDTSSKYSDSMENDISLQIDQTSPKEASSGTLDNELSTEKVLPSVSEENVVEDDTSSKSSDSMENDISLQIDQTSPKEASTGILDNELSTEKVLPSVSEENVVEDDTSSKSSDSMENDISLQIDQTSPKEASTGILDNELSTEKVLPSVSEENVVEDDTSSKSSDSMENDISLQIDQTSPKEASTGTLDNELSTEKVLPSVSEENVVEDNTSSESGDLIESERSLQTSSTEEFSDEIINNDHLSKRIIEKEISSFSLEMSETSLIENEQPMITLTVDNLIKNMDL